MTTETVLTDEQIQQAAQCLTSEASIEGDSLVLKNVNGCICAIEQAVLQSPEVQRLREDADLYRKLKGAIVTGSEFSGPMDAGGPEKWCVMRRKAGVISSFTGEDLDFSVRHASAESKP